MPIYEYTCTSCHHSFDLMQKINEEPAELCPQCSKNTLVKLVSAAGFQLKGTGWYQTDFKNKDSAPKDKNPGNDSVNKTPEGPKSDNVAKSNDTTAQPTKGEST